MIHRHLAAGLSSFSLGLVCVQASHAAAEENARVQLAALDLKRLSIEDLMNLEVTSVSKHAERLADAPSSIF